MERIHGRTVQKKILINYVTDGVVSHPEKEILECEVILSLGSTVINKLVDMTKFQ